MQFPRNLQVVAAFLACLGVLIPAPLLCGEMPPVPVPPFARSPNIVDIALHEGGTLLGLVVDSQGRPSPRGAVALRHVNREMARTFADQNGRFVVNGLLGGTYEIAAAGTTGLYRLWAANTAPPSAQPVVVIVEGGVRVRGQQPAAQLLGNPWVLTAVVAAAIAVPVALTSRQTDPASRDAVGQRVVVEPQTTTDEQETAKPISP